MSRKFTKPKKQFMNYFIHCLKNYANFKGRARRKEFWMFALFNLLLAMIFLGLDNLLGTTIKLNLPGQGETPFPYGYLYLAYGLSTFIPSLAVTVRRLHDIGKSGWWYFVAFIPCLGIFPIFYFMVKAGEVGENQYGPDPKA
jgi:uncharacterized membrane protein YhaH (DUF805 family)